MLKNTLLLSKFWVVNSQWIFTTPQPEANYLHAAIMTVFQIHTTRPKGDILGFEAVIQSNRNSNDITAIQRTERKPLPLVIFIIQRVFILQLIGIMLRV